MDERNERRARPAARTGPGHRSAESPEAAAADGAGTAGTAGGGEAAENPPHVEAGEDARGAEADFRALAEDWITIWQSEITAYLTDPETQQAWSAMLAAWAGAAQAMMRVMPQPPAFGTGFPAGFGPGFAAPRPAARDRAGRRARAPQPADEGVRGAEPDAAAGADAPPGAPPAALPPDARDDEVRRLERRVADLERHLADRERADRERAEQERQRGALASPRRARGAGRPRS